MDQVGLTFGPELLLVRTGQPVEFTEEDTSALTNDTAQRAMTTLEFSSQVTLLLHDYCGLTYDEVARAAGIGRSAVPRDLDRARRAVPRGEFDGGDEAEVVFARHPGRRRR